MESKIAALEALKVTAASEFGSLEAIQHIATGMLLCSFEVWLVRSMFNNTSSLN